MWSIAMESLLISLIRDRRSLWDHRVPDYHKRYIRTEQMREVIQFLKEGFPDKKNLINFEGK